MPPKGTKTTNVPWTVEEDNLIITSRTTAPPAAFTDFYEALNNLDSSPGTRTLTAVKQRWTKVLQHRCNPDLSEKEQELLVKAVENVERRRKWEYVVEEYGKLVKKMEGEPEEGGKEQEKVTAVNVRKLYEDAVVMGVEEEAEEEDEFQEGREEKSPKTLAKKGKATAKETPKLTPSSGKRAKSHLKTKGQEEGSSPETEAGDVQEQGSTTKRRKVEAEAHEHQHHHHPENKVNQNITETTQHVEVHHEVVITNTEYTQQMGIGLTDDQQTQSLEHGEKDAEYEDDDDGR